MFRGYDIYDDVRNSGRVQCMLAARISGMHDCIHHPPSWCGNLAIKKNEDWQSLTKTWQLILILYISGLYLGGGFKDFLFSPLFGEDSHSDEHIFQRG